MAKLNVDDFIKGLKHLAMNRVTYYDNSFPANCGEIHSDGSISFDCIGLVKSTINEPDICYKTSPAGYYVTPGKVIPDTTEIGILNLCSGVQWHDFSKIVKGEYLYMADHAGIFCGEFTHAGGTVNTIECTTDFGDNGVTTSYLTPDGRRFDHKGGTPWRPWEAHGKLANYVDYETAPRLKWEQKWHLYDDKKMLTGWKKVNGKWYFMDSNGIMQTGWLKDGGLWYLLSNNGDMLTGWQKVNGKWYYLTPQNDGTHKTGEMWTGWLKKDGKWYYLDPKDGYMYTGTHIIDGKTYYFDNSGVLLND